MKFSAITIVLAAFFLSSEAMLNGQVWNVAPYMARVVFSNLQGQGAQAGGTIISHRHVLTSGFIITADLVNLQVWVGGTTRQTQNIHPVQTRINHPNYQASPRLNDIGIIVLATDLVFTRLIQPIALPAIPAPGTAPAMIPFLNEQGTALGFGFPQQENLQAAFLRVVIAERCSGQYPSHQVQNQFCAEDARVRSDICSNDISGPFVTLERGVDVLTGVSSTPFCNQIQPIQPSLFTRVSAYRTWIFEQAGV